ncbi:hypothetical protein C8J56DRAFT_1031995 [Mycena floridula]|nr:hypothetical protein C8J56DRAFT_1031995 [Mycena floridula]
MSLPKSGMPVPKRAQEEKAKHAIMYLDYQYRPSSKKGSSKGDSLSSSRSKPRSKRAPFPSSQTIYNSFPPGMAAEIQRQLMPPLMPPAPLHHHEVAVHEVSCKRDAAVNRQYGLSVHQHLHETLLIILISMKLDDSLISMIESRFGVRARQRSTASSDSESLLDPKTPSFTVLITIFAIVLSTGVMAAQKVVKLSGSWEVDEGSQCTEVSSRETDYARVLSRAVSFLRFRVISPALDSAVAPAFSLKFAQFIRRNSLYTDLIQLPPNGEYRPTGRSASDSGLVPGADPHSSTLLISHWNGQMTVKKGINVEFVPLLQLLAANWCKSYSHIHDTARTVAIDSMQFLQFSQCRYFFSDVGCQASSRLEVRVKVSFRRGLPAWIRSGIISLSSRRYKHIPFCRQRGLTSRAVVSMPGKRSFFGKVFQPGQGLA